MQHEPNQAFIGSSGEGYPDGRMCPYKYQGAVDRYRDGFQKKGKNKTNKILSFMVE